MNFLYLMDPLHTVIMEKDTTLVLMVGAKRRGHKVYFLPNGGITRVNGKTHFHVVEVTPQLDKQNPFIEHQSSVLTEDEVDVIFIRTDPPFNYDYLENTWLLDLLPERVAVINDPKGIREANEKIWTTQFTSLVPPTLVGRNRKDLMDFLKDEDEIVIKPTDGHGGRSVFHVKDDDMNANVILETLTDHWKKNVILQKYVPESQDGDKRILLLNGEPLGAVLRLHAEDDHRNNFFSGGQPLATKITDEDLVIIDAIKPALVARGLYFVGIDILGKYLTEINVTSPTCLQEMNRLYNQQLEDQVIEFAEKLVDQKRSQDKIHS